MNKLLTPFFCIALFLFAGNSPGQETGGSSVSGKVIEESTQEPMEFVTAAMYHAKDSSLVKGVITDKNGRYTITDVADGNYYLLISWIGYQTERTNSFAVAKNNPPVDLGTTAIKISNKSLSTVEVSAERSIYETAIDRKIYNVDKDLMSKSGSASEVMANIPSVSVDVDGTVSLRGSANVTIFINGKPSALMRINSAEALQQIPANTIERIEIITNPSAKYKPDGTAGIINIVLKKDARQGFNATLIANVGNNSRENANILLNYKPGKFNFHGNYAIRQDERTRTNTDNRILKDSLGAESSLFHMSTSSFFRPLSHSAEAGVDYAMNDKNEFGLSANYFYMGFLRTDKSTSTLTDMNHFVMSDYDRNRVDNEFEWDEELAFTYGHKFKKEDHELQVEVATNRDHEKENNHFTDVFRTPSYEEAFDNTVIEQKQRESNITVEYVLPISEDAELEAGYEGDLLQKDFIFSGEYFDESNDSWIKDKEKTNTFIFSQNVHALYATYSSAIEDFGYMVGLRGEQAHVTSNLVTLDSVVPNNYLSLYPTLHLSYELSDEQELQLNYSRRVNRPEDDDLNPFPEYANPRNLSAGNPYLKPEQIHSIEMGYQLRNNKITLVPSIYYQYEYNSFTRVSKYINDTTLLTTFENLASNQSTGIELVISKPVKKFMTLNFSANGYYNTIDASNLAYSKSRSAFTWNAKLSVSATLSPSTVMQVNSNYTSAQVIPQGKILPVFVLNAGLRQDLFKKKAALSLTVSDVFNTLNRTIEIATPEMQQKIISKRKSQFIYLGFTYRFGRSGKKQAEDLKFDEKL